MPSSVSAKKRVRQNAKRRLKNRVAKKVIKTLMKRTLASAAATELEKVASDIKTAGILTGVGMAAEGGGALAGAFVSSTNWGDGLKGAGKMGNGAAAIGGAFANSAAANDDANAAAAKSASDQAKSAAEDEHDAKKSAGDFISAALDFYREYTSAQASAQTAALHRA